jgi:Uma2 family endonuclease
MQMSGSEHKATAGVVIDGHHYLAAPAPLHFPTEAEVPETKRHLELRTLLSQVLKLAFAERAAVGCEQFVYWDPTDPRACLEPDAFVHFGATDPWFRSWKVWEHGAPQVAVEIISESDEHEGAWEEKLERYRRLGVSELVRFDPEAQARPLRVWDRVAEQLLERRLALPCAQSRFLDGFWVAVQHAECGLTLRLSVDAQGSQLLPTPAEHEAEGRQHEAEKRRVAEQRVLELEAALRRRSP